MSDAEAPLRRVIPVQPRALNRSLYLEACRAKGATTQEARAQLFGLTRQNLSRYEAGRVEPLLSTAQWFASCVDITVEALWSGTRKSKHERAAA